jgi:hypothetical protein
MARALLSPTPTHGFSLSYSLYLCLPFSFIHSLALSLSLSVRLTDRFPKEPPALWLQKPFERELADAPATPAEPAADGAIRLDNVPYSPRWTPEDMVARFLCVMMREGFCVCVCARLSACVCVCLCVWDLVLSSATNLSLSLFLCAALT